MVETAHCGAALHETCFSGAQMARVLVVDDDPTIRSLLRIVVERQGYAVDAAADGVDALSYLNASRYDVALIDLMMPRLNGYDLLREIETYREPPTVLMVTAMSDAHTRTLNSKLIHSIVRKPFDVDEVGALIGALLRELDAQRPATRDDVPLVPSRERPAEAC